MPIPVILHISDTHRTQDETVPTSEILNYLERDIGQYESEQIPFPNVMVVSGDLVQSAEPSEYKEALLLLRGLAKRLNINPKDIVVVPGNHDIHWPTALKNARLGADAPIASIEREGLRVGYLDESSFQDRLQNFRTFYRELKGKDYPTLRTDALTSDVFSDMNLEFFGFSSVDKVHQYSLQGSINAEPIRNATLRSRESQRRTIAVWHHDLDWIRSSSLDCLDVASLRLLSTGPFLIGLCGHTHRPANNDVVTISGFKLPVLSAGSLCAGPRQRPESVARSYNIIQLNENAARVWIRIKRQKDLPWESCWEFGPPTDRRPWFDIIFGIDASNAPPTSIARRKPGTGKSPNPFSELNAKSVSPARIGKQYVPTVVSSQIRHDLPQILLGSRGTGKTALLYTLTLEAQRATQGRALSFEYVGLYCPMKTSDVSAFNGKGWMLERERETLFSAFIAAVWSLQMVKALEKLLSDEKAWVNILTNF